MFSASDTSQQNHNTPQDKWKSQPIDTLSLPVANTTRVMKNSVSMPNGSAVRISKDAQEYMTEVATEFLSFIASEAADVPKGSVKPKHTLTGTDIIDALDRLGFEDYCLSLQKHLKHFHHMNAQDEGYEAKKGFYESHISMNEEFPPQPPC
ncbi:CBF/NF-Y transcription factor family protein [Entamoeba histolytica HM-1:IMSS-B]|uniref:Nuclear transcription factor, putative n=6 Tax=Entamoeba histolytica TaxID=5759 RepID=C4M4Q8_ENTH1|nr:nuclear transcription factor, putative [Entamoeba histolytica HM-1:IMSS]EMD49459.1 nuclear transcription factor, putative [Entamoeba histolytica KU27]EMH77979.1 CBF/NF-Y transcription factor family protein [Entamoeba histolytica HM-1:IMSS-B]EMS12780.1 nuclear transcription factor, putative [Entamoeba histolytica HM-3:IMSS]ENY64136.1 nuclear transcription factor, putative [Entamoeba histolytica HM-1:IMSS-A]EAL45553.2 nuclear transcription factor, putative [Entamoeba histolytica HM-1:IMSS]|eukprot:XP_650939.2 nuclear transcription factor, putative [Entamoeba histolytica HM-1:IMSS]